MIYWLILGILELLSYLFIYHIIDILLLKYRRNNNKINKNTRILISGAGQGLVKENYLFK